MKKLTATLAALLVAACANSLTGPLDPSSWGGTGIQLDITGSTAHAEFDCGSADVVSRIDVIDGSFSVHGTVTVGHGGPTIEGQPPDLRAATFAGKIDGDQMSLDVVVSGTTPYTSHYDLKRGVQGLLRRCL